MDQSPGPHTPETAPTADTPPLETDLSGDLPCVVCRYNLRGLSILSVCPECGTRIRATILAHVDPHAAELRPLRLPRLLAASILLWAFGALAAGLICWYPQLVALAAGLRGRGAADVDVRVWVVVAAGLSWLGAIGLVSPQKQMAKRDSMYAMLAVLAYVPLGWALWCVAEFSAAGEIGVIGRWPPLPERTVWRIVAGAMVAVIALSLRPNARLLVARSLILRTGRVDRQTLLALAAAAAVWVLGDLLSLAVANMTGFGGQIGRIVAVVLVVTGSILVTLGLFGAAIDAVRIAASILRPAPSLQDLVTPSQRATAARGAAAANAARGEGQGGDGTGRQRDAGGGMGGGAAGGGG